MQTEPASMFCALAQKQETPLKKRLFSESGQKDLEKKMID